MVSRKIPPLIISRLQDSCHSLFKNRRSQENKRNRHPESVGRSCQQYREYAVERIFDIGRYSLTDCFSFSLLLDRQNVAGLRLSYQHRLVDVCIGRSDNNHININNRWLASSPDFVTGTPYSKTGHQIGGRSVYVDLSGA